MSKRRRTRTRRNNKKTIIIVAIVAAVLIGIVVAGILLTKDKSADTATVQSVSTICASGNAAGIGNVYAGMVESQKTVNVNANTSYKIAQTYVKVGSAVKAGDKLYVTKNHIIIDDWSSNFQKSDMTVIDMWLTGRFTYFKSNVIAFVAFLGQFGASSDFGAELTHRIRSGIGTDAIFVFIINGNYCICDIVNVVGNFL